MFKVTYLNAAQSDLVDIARYIRDRLQNTGAAEKTVSKIVKGISNLQNHPFMAPEYVPIRPLSREYRKLVIDDYIVLYFVDFEGKTVTVARIVNGRQNYDKQLKENRND